MLGKQRAGFDCIPGCFSRLVRKLRINRPRELNRDLMRAASGLGSDRRRSLPGGLGFGPRLFLLEHEADAAAVSMQLVLEANPRDRYEFRSPRCVAEEMFSCSHTAAGSHLVCRRHLRAVGRGPWFANAVEVLDARIPFKMHALRPDDTRHGRGAAPGGLRRGLDGR